MTKSFSAERKSYERSFGGGAAPHLPDTEIFHVMPSDSGTVLVSFGAKGGGHGHFHFFKLLKPLPHLTKLLVRDPAGSWYNAGLPGVGDTVEEIAERIEQELADLGATRVITSGSSMGGYAAILFGCLLGAERAIALAPQTLLDPGLRHTPPAGVSLQVPDLAPIIRGAPDTKVDLVAGWDDPLDVFHAQRIAELPSVRVLALRNGVHAFVEDLHREGKLVPLITELIGGGTPELCDIDPPLDPDTEERIADTIFAVQREEWVAVAERIGPVAERHPGWAGPNFELGRALAKMKEWQNAEVANARAVQANPRWTQPRAYLVTTLLEQDRATEAEGVARSGLALDENWASGHLYLGRCLMRLGRPDEGRSAALRAAELDPELAGAAERLLG